MLNPDSTFLHMRAWQSVRHQPLFGSQRTWHGLSNNITPAVSLFCQAHAMATEFHLGLEDDCLMTKVKTLGCYGTAPWLDGETSLAKNQPPLPRCTTSYQGHGHCQR